MASGDLPLMDMLKTRMRWHTERQNVLAENVANANTPTYKAKDLKAVDFTRSNFIAPARTDPLHLASLPNNGNAGENTVAKTFETVPSGNSVVLEDEMIKVGQNQTDFQAVASLYQQNLSLLRAAIGKK